MENNLSEIPFSIRIINLTSLIFLLVGIVLTGSFIFVKTLEFTIGHPVMNVMDILASSSISRNQLLLAQFCSQVISFISIPLLTIFFIYKDMKKLLKLSRRQIAMLSLCAVVITLMSIPFIAYLSQLNKSLVIDHDLPVVFRNWILKSEKEVEGLTYILAYYHSGLGLVSGLIVIAVLPAIGEELLFRGIIQTQLIKIFVNPHAAIVVTGFLFSFIHFQFLGFLPRMFLGVLFGYMFYWSGSLLIPMLMHFTNNAVSYFALNLLKQRKITVNLEATSDIPTSTVVLSIVMFVFLLLWFIKLSKENFLLADFKNGRLFK